MNIISAITGLAIAGAAAPSMMQMSIAPFEAQKRAQNLSIAESAAVIFAANNEGAQSLADAPKGCVTDQLSGDAYTVTCTEGEGRWKQTVTRAFRLMPDNNSSGNSSEPRSFPYISRPLGAHQCHTHDPWGISWRQQWPTLEQCIPAVLWNKDTYLQSNPDDWLWDVNRMRGYGSHPDY